MIYRTKNGQPVPYSNYSDNIIEDASDMSVEDTYGLVGAAGNDSNVQDMTDAIVNRSNTTLANLADVESTSTASKAYAVGDHLVYNGVLYKVTAAIANGATLTVGTNIEATQVEDEIDETNDQINAIVNVYGSKNLCRICWPEYDAGDSIIASLISGASQSGEISFPAINDIRSSYAFLEAKLKANVPYIMSIHGGLLQHGRLELVKKPHGVGDGSPVHDNTAKIIDGTDMNLSPNNYGYNSLFLFDSDYTEYTLTPVHDITIYACFINDVNHDNAEAFTRSFMIRDARIKDPTYVPFCYTNQQLSGMVEADYGAGVNLIDPQYIQSDTVINGVTYHVTEDYVINISGTREENGWPNFDIFPGHLFPPYLQKGKTYKLVVNGISNSHIWVAIHPYYSDAWGVPLVKIHIGTAYFTVPNDVTALWIRTEIEDDYTGDCTASLGVMITEVNALTDKYYPKILTNKELMDSMTDWKDYVNNYIGSYGDSHLFINKGSGYWMEAKLVPNDNGKHAFIYHTSDNAGLTWIKGFDSNNNAPMGFGYGTTSTAAATAEKVVTMDDPDWRLVKGCIIVVGFTYKNTSTTMKLNVNNTGAIDVYHAGTAHSNMNANYITAANANTAFMYDGTYWRIFGLNYSSSFS